MKFYGYFRSSAAWRCRIAFNLKGIEPTETRFVHLRRDGGEQRQRGYLEVNPQGLVPALETADGVLTQSLAIVEWLDETVADAPLLPSDPFMRARARAFALTIACDIHPLQNLRILDYLGSHFGQEQDGKDAWCRHWIAAGLAACEKMVLPDTPFCFGETPGLADLCLVPQMASAARFGLDTKPLLRLTAIEARCDALPAFKAAAPGQQPDFER